MRECPFDECPFDECPFDECPFDECPFDECPFDECPFDECPFDECPFDECPFDECPFDKCPFDRGNNCEELAVLGKHAHGDSKLTCIDCSEVICSKCMVQCPVGFRCSKCGNVKNPFTSVSPLLVVRALGICVATGFGFGYVLPFINLPWIGCFICYFAGLFIGRHLTKFLDYKMGRNIGTIIVFGLLIGMALTPLRYLPLSWGLCMAESFGSGTDVFGGLGCVVSSIFAPAIFVVGILRPTIWGDR